MAAVRIVNSSKGLLFWKMEIISPSLLLLSFKPKKDSIFARMVEIIIIDKSSAIMERI